MNQLVAKREWKTEEGFDHEYVFWWIAEDELGEAELCISLGGNDKLDEITIPIEDLKKELNRRGR